MGRDYKNSSALESYMKQLDCKRLDNEEINELFKVYIESGKTDRAVRDRIYNANQLLVVSIASKLYVANDDELMDLVQQGNEKLLEAIERYNPENEKKAAFSTYAYKCIYRGICEYISNNKGLVRITKDTRSQMNEVSKAISHLQQKLNKESVSAKEVADYLGMSIERVSDLMSFSRLDDMTSLDTPIDGEDKGSATVQDMVADKSDSIAELDDKLSKGKKTAYKNRLGNETLALKERLISFYNEEQELLKSSPLELFRGIEETNTAFALNRLICTLYPESEFAQLANGNYNQDFNKNQIGKRNKLIKAAIDEFIPPEYQKSFPLFPDYSCDVYDVLTKTARLESNKREKCFMAAIALNLEFEQLENYMVHSIGERVLDFKNPYELLIAYCVNEHTNVCENYLRLKSTYEKAKADIEKPVESKSTLEYKNAFLDISGATGESSEKELIALLLTLPEGNSKAANRAFQANIATIKMMTSDKLKSFGEEISFDKLYRVAADLCKRTRVNAEFFQNYGVSTASIIKDILGTSSKENAIKNMKDKVFNSDNLSDFLNNEKVPTKEQLLLIVFYRYCISNERDGVILNLSDKDNFVEALYKNFEQYTYPTLKSAGYDGLHILDNFERILFFCILTEEPFKTFQLIFNSAQGEQ